MGYDVHYISYRMARAPLLQQIGIRIREIREASGITQKVLAERSGVSSRFLAQLEAGDGNISVLRLADVARALGVSAGDVVGDAEAFLRAAERGPLIALLGLRGAGKSTIGPKLAERLGVPFFELD